VFNPNGERVPSRRSVDSVFKKQATRRSGGNGDSPPTTLNTFCTRIDERTYEEQRRAPDRELLKLLDDAIGDENMEPSKKAKMLNTVVICFHPVPSLHYIIFSQFRLTYPSLYYSRFPFAKGAVTVNQSPAQEERTRIRLIKAFKRLMT